MRLVGSPICALTLAATLVGCREACAEQSSWCEGDVRKLCVKSGGGDFQVGDHYYVRSDDCSHKELSCYEGSSRTAHCGLLDAGCPGDRTGICLGDTTGHCPPGADHPVPGVDCSEHDSFCILDADGGPVCTEVAENCDDRGHPVRCFMARPFVCEDAVWRPFACEGDPLCGCGGSLPAERM